MVHGDIKPSNIQICSNGEVCLLDFGISKAITFTHHLTHHNLGSPSYCSPERLRRSQVDPHSDLWALGATLYEMVAGFPPYQAQNTQKLEELIRSKRPPRALPEGCPAALKAIIRKALAGEMENRYASAAAFQADLQNFLLHRPTQAETEKQHAWEANPTVERPRDTAKPAMKLPVDIRAWIGRAWIPVAAVIIGAVVGALCYIETAYAFRFWVDSKPLRGYRDYTHRGVADINADWALFKTLEQRNVSMPLGIFSPVAWLSQPLRTSYVSAADDVIERYRNKSNPLLNDTEWHKAQAALQHAAELDGSDSAVKGKLALVNGYLTLLQRVHKRTRRLYRPRQALKRRFRICRDLPIRTLALARLYIYNFRNIGRALAEFSNAERFGFKAGPREFEQQADGYLLRAEQELQQAQAAGASRADSAKSLSLAQNDLERARNLYEPFDGFSNITASLSRLYRDRAKLQALQEKFKPAAAPKRYSRRPRSWR